MSEPSIMVSLEEQSIYSNKSCILEPNVNVWVTVDGYGMVKEPTCPYCNQEAGASSKDAGSRAVVQRYTFRNRNQMTVQVITYGAIITGMWVPDKYGKSEDILMGFDSLEDYKRNSRLKFGSTVRGDSQNPTMYCMCCEDVAKMRGKPNDRSDQQSCPNKTLLNSVWTPHLLGTVLTLTLVTDCHVSGFPGRLMARVTYELKNNNSFLVSYSVTTTKPTPVNIYNQLFFNLAGHGAGHNELYKHVFTLNADRIIVKDENECPTGQIQCVGGTINDLRVPHELGPAISRCPKGGYDEYMCLIQGTEQTLTFVGRVVHPRSGRVLEMYTDQPGFQFYTGNNLPDPCDNINPPEVYTQDYFEIPSANMGRLSIRSEPRSCGECEENEDVGENECKSNILEFDEEGEGEFESESCNESEDEFIIGKNGVEYMRHGAFVLSSQQYPNATDLPDVFPSITLFPGQMYKHEIMYTFGLYVDNSNKVPMEFCEEEEADAEEEGQEQECFPI